MNIEEFCLELEKVKNDYKWHFSTDRHGWDSIRAGIDDISHCPITALVFEKTKKTFIKSYYIEAAAEIGLSYEDSQRIAVAADGWVDNGWYESTIRCSLLQVLGLTIA
jgi:hypothetical protein